MSALAPALHRLADERLFLGCVAGSLAFHVFLLNAGRLCHPSDAPVEVEFDLTVPDAALGPVDKPRGPSGRAAAPREESWTPAPPAATTAAGTAVEPAEDAPAVPDAGAGAVGPAGGSGGGSGVTTAPRLLDQGQLDRLLQRYYPDSERRLGHEGVVLLDLSLDDEGHVVGVEVVGSSDPAFEPAARTAAARLRYAPARAGDRPVSVKIRQPVQFRLSR